MAHIGRSLGLGLLVALAALYLLASGGLKRMDHLFYDLLIRAQQHPANEEVLIVAVDERSLRELGRWPWPRRVHARLVERLMASGVRAIGFDVLFSEPDLNDPEGDALLARAIEASGRVVLVVGPEERVGQAPIAEVLPIADLALSAAALGHVDFELDDDGIARGVYLYGGLAEPRWPVMGLALLEIAHPDHPSLTQWPAPEGGGSGTGWVRSRPVLIPFAGPPGHYDQVSYSDVLEGRLPEAVLRDRIVMIGATAVGLGDVLSTPFSQAHTLMAGIEINANVLGGLLDQRLLHDSTLAQRSVFNLLLVLPLLAWLILLPSRFALPGFVLMGCVTLATSTAILTVYRVWVPPTIPLLVQFLLFVLWSWLDLRVLTQLTGRLSLQIHAQARHDRLTGLPNQAMLEEKLAALIAPGDEARRFSLMVMHVGKHRAVSELAGIKGQNALLKRVTARMKGVMPFGENIFRLGGTDFALLIEEADAPNQVEAIASRLVQSLQRPFDLEGHQFTLTSSVGACHYPMDGNQPSELIENATSAMQRAREDRRRNFFFYSRGIRVAVHKKLKVELALQKVLDNQELQCLYQPQVAVADGRLVGVETLVRWDSPALGRISPAEFIPIAEQQGLIVAIGDWILEQACAQARRWHASGIVDLRIAVNLSATQLEHPGLVAQVAHALGSSGLRPGQLELEVTETALLGDLDKAIGTLAELKTLGVELAIDDFGTGYSSLSYLQRFPMDRIKIDQAFVRDVNVNSESAEITRSIIEMAHRLNLEVIAEGVETPEHLAFLRANGCEEAQGYLFGKPMQADALERAILAGELRLGTARREAG